MKRTFYSLFVLCSFLTLITTSLNATASPAAAGSYYAIRIYHAVDNEHEALVEKYLQTAFLPALHRMGYKTVGVFKPVGNDTAADKKVYVYFPFKSLDDLTKLPMLLEIDKEYATADTEYTNAQYNQPAFTRFETIVLHAFEKAPQMSLPQLKGNKADRIYELRSYESPSEKYYLNKVQMFNQGGETVIFKRLNFNAVFYAEVVSGSHMPNLMYMTTFDSMQSREEHWKAFNNDAAWKKVSSMPGYQHNVSKADILFLTPLDFSDF